ncbi:MAG TPA: hypothetical protein VNH18_24535, partial [Bryobacteraceae bacterium]|nr:hypothetical protein [Bryobacteraceae bacterium]
MRDLVAALSLNRRTFLQSVTGATLCSTLGPTLRAAPNRFSKAVVVTFGGGARDDETFSPAGRQYIPRMLADLTPRATFYSRVVNRGILGHYVANASLVSGVYETINNFTGAPPQNPTVFEYFRKDLKRPASDVWVIAPSIGFDRIGESSHRAYGGGLGAGVILPKRLLASVVGPGGHQEFDHLLHDNYETPLHVPELSRERETVDQLGSLLKLSVDDFTGHARTLTSPDELSVFIAKRLMKRYAPSLLWITLHDIDIAHSGT